MTQNRNTYYDRCNRFYLNENDYTEYQPNTVVDVSTMTRVNEPVGWDNVNIVLNRDLTRHGVTTSFTDGEQELQFECKAGRSLLREQYLNYGTDAQVKFLFGDYDEGTGDFTVQFSADCNFNLFKYDDLFSSVTVEMRDFASIVNSKFEIDVPLDTNVVGAKEVGLASKVLPELVNLKHVGFGLYERAPLETSRLVAYYMPQYREGVRTKFDELTIPNYNGTFVGEDPKVVKRYLFQVERSGQYDISVNTCLEYPIGQMQPTVRLKTALYREKSKSFLGLGATIAPTSTEGILDPFGFLVSTRYFFENITYSQLSLPDLLLEGDEVYLYFEITNPAVIRIGELFRIPNIVGKDFGYNIIVKSVFPATRITALPTKIVLQQILDAYLADVPAYSGATIESDFLDECDNLVITNGLTLRDANTTNGLDVTVRASMRTMLDMLDAVYACGFSFEYDSNNKVMRIEPYNYYYKDSEIIHLDNVDIDYEEGAYTDTTYNELSFGYDTFSKQRDDSSDFKDSSLDDVHAKSSYTTPIKTHKGKYEKICPVVFSGYEIEAQRRIQFNEKEIEDAKSYKNDEKLFAIAITERNTSRTLSGLGLAVNQLVLIGVLKPFIKVNDNISLQLSDGTPIGSAVTVDAIDYQGLSTFITYSGATSLIPIYDTNVTTTFSLLRVVNNTASRTVQEGDENIAFIDGINNIGIDRANYLEAEYNLRFTPKRMMFAHAGLINNCLLEKSDSDQIKFVIGEGNVELITTLSSFYDCVNGDINRKKITEKNNVLLSEFNNKEALYRNRLITFSHVLTFEQFNDIRFAHLNKVGYDNFGYISFVDLEGVTRKGYVVNINFNIVENKAEFELLESGDVTAPPPVATPLSVADKRNDAGEACEETEVFDTIYTDDVTPIAGSSLYLTSLLTGTVTSGFYKWFLSDGTTKVIEVDVNSEVVAITDCTTAFEVNVGQTTFGTSALACNSNDNTIVRYSDDADLIVGSFVYSDGGLATVLADGFYKISGGRNIQIGSGEILAINTCPTIYTHYVTVTNSGFAEACNSIGSVSAFSADDTIIVGSAIFSDGSLSNLLPDGYYRLEDTAETVFIDSGAVAEIRDCGDFGQATVYWGGSATATPSAAQVQALLFSDDFFAPESGGDIQLGFPDIASGDFVVVSFPDVWFDLVDITDITGQFSWFQDWQRAADVTIGGETYRVYVTVEEVANLTYDFRFFFEDNSGS